MEDRIWQKLESLLMYAPTVLLLAMQYRASKRKAYVELRQRQLVGGRYG